ncbi:glycerophosphodiester phosphodiesterase [Lactiplantibacillus modestisalitolerans]|uniref:Glycerophosphoryl diester phosphodiesterase membrane domain-containing protein n=1 Tax=Lactiplantibacillus modestisalitolerans TaxID=1457219 RepID=A0ABV5WVX1_9LACO|nr:glycerophosphodiester phosphodiesterase [Lactiplantibacillus modestisalitolerans]
MGAWQFWWGATRRFYRNWGSYVALIFGTNLVISYLAIPFFNEALELLLKSQGVAYVSYTNFAAIARQAPLAMLGMLVLLVALIELVYWQFAFLLLGITNILRGRPQTVRQVLRATVGSLRHTSLSSFPLFVGYFIVILPFGSFMFTTPLLNKARIPAFIVSFLMDNPWMTVALAAFYLITGYLGLRLIALLPLMILDQLPWRIAVRRSWSQTRHRTLRNLWAMLVILLMTGLSVSLIYGVLYVAQLAWDQTTLAMGAATVNLFLMEIATEILICYTTALFMMLFIALYRQDLSLISKRPRYFNEPPHLKRWTRTGVVAGLVLASGVLVGFNLIYLNGLAISKPLIIAHRGVDHHNGVQNTIPALKKTAQAHPAYVEMDVQVTKDHQFVVMHDTNLKTLTGKNVRTANLTLAQLQRLTVRENGHAAKIPSFDAYLQAAHQSGQRLLVEIKTNRAYTRADTRRFVQRYGASLKQHHDQVQTLSYRVMSDLKQRDQQQTTSYILPYNLTFPHTVADGYTMEVTTLNDRFVDKAERAHKLVYAWDIDDEDQMTQMMFMGVDGVITNNTRQMQRQVRTTTEHPSYAKLLLTFMNELSLTDQS